MEYDEEITSEVSADAFCGANLEEDAAFQNFFFESQGTPERYDGQTTTPAEPPDWRSVKKQALEYFKSTRDIKLICIFAQAVLNTEGIIKFESCLSGLTQLLQSHWPDVFPPLDEDDGDPLERIAALGHLCDNAFVIQPLKSMPLVESKGVGIVSLRVIEQAVAGNKENTEGGLEIGQIKGVFKDADNDSVVATYNAAKQCITHLHAIDQTFISKAGSKYSVDFASLTDVLNQLVLQLEQFARLDVEVTQTDQPSDSEPESAEQISAANAQAGNNAMTQNQLNDSSLRLTSRKDVERCFDLICNYYDEFEPSSPIPILINRSKKLVNLDFVDIVKDIFPDGLEHVQKLGGLSQAESESNSDSSGSSW